MKKPKDLIFSNSKYATLSEAGSSISDGENFKWPREVAIETGPGLNAKETERLIRWLEKSILWLKEKAGRE